MIPQLPQQDYLDEDQVFYLSLLL